MIIELQQSYAWKIQLTIAINSFSSKDVEEERVTHSKCDNVKFMSYDNVSDIVDEIFKTLLSRYQDNLEPPMRESDFIFDSVQLLYDKCHRISFRRGGSYNDSPDWIKKKKANI